MQNKARDIKEIAAGLRKRAVEARTLTSDPDELADITFELYPIEVVRGAQAVLGDKLSDYFVEMYEFAQQAHIHNQKIKKTQLNGILLTHQKIERWLKKQSVASIANLQNPVVTRIFLQHHIKAMKEATQVFQLISDSITGEEE